MAKEPTEEATKSERFLNYCKGIGALIAALGSIIAIVISVRTAYKEPEERVAKTGYKAVEQIVEKLSNDLRQEHTERTNSDKLVAKDIENLRSELKMVVQLLSMQRVTYRRPAASPYVSAAPPQAPPQEILDTLKGRVAKASAVAKAEPAPAPPPRKLPSLDKIQQQAQTAPPPKAD